MSFLIPEPQITLYETVFPEYDPLSRQSEGEKLSRLVEGIDQPMVVALDGGWGSGKTVFLKYWVGQHSQDYGDDTACVYFDAFANDYMDQPLNGLTAELLRRYPPDETDQWSIGRLVRNNTGSILKGLVRVGAASLSGGMSEIIGPGLGKVTEAVVKETAKKSVEELQKAANQYLSKENERKSAMAVFGEALMKITQPDEENKPTKRLVFVVDELDRCRPNYALSVLETIKHFFAIPGVHFVLGTNLDALTSSVEASYGLKHGSRAYLTKFIDLTFHLPNDSPSNTGTDRHEVALLKNYCSAVRLSEDFARQLELHIELLQDEYRPSLREVRKLVGQAKLIDAVAQNKVTKWITILSGLLLMRVTMPIAYDDYLASKLDHTFIPGLLNTDGYAEHVRQTWAEFYVKADGSRDFPGSKKRNMQSMNDLLNAFSFPEDPQ